MCSALVRTWPAMLVTTGTCGSRRGERSMISASREAACCISGECEAMLIRSGTTVRAPLSRISSIARLSAARSPEMTNCSGELALATLTMPPVSFDACLHACSSTLRSRPITAAMPPGR